jgi:hypothetical protein
MDEIQQELADLKDSDEEELYEGLKKEKKNKLTLIRFKLVKKRS